MNTDYRVIVVGCGGIGSAAAYWLGRDAGSAVLGLEQFPLGHSRGASQDHSRIIRLAQHQDAYADLAPDAYDAWHAVERRHGVECERLDAAEIVRRWPQFTLNGSEQGIYQAESGFVDAGKAN